MLNLSKTIFARFSKGTIFDKILNKTIPSQAVYEDNLIYAFNDIKPQAPVHVLVIPKIHDGLTGISKAESRHKDILGHMLATIPTIAAKAGLTSGYRLVINEGAQGGQEEADKCVGRQADPPSDSLDIINHLMQESDTRNSLRSSFHERRHQELAHFLTQDMGLDPQVAHALLRLHHPFNLRDTMELFVQTQDGLANHFFIPKSETNTCWVCEKLPEQHIESDAPAVKLELQRQSQSSSHSENEDEQAPPLPHQACEICYIEVVEADLVKINEEVHAICLQCMENYIREEINNMRVQELTCPHCRAPLPNQLIRSLLDLPTYNKYRQFLRNLQIQKNPNLKWCPNPKCSVVVSTNSSKKTSKCPKCATQICNRCNREGHPKTSCEGAFRKQIKNWENASDIQKCKKCHGLVQKIAGCNHMTCSVCHYEWCWLCGSEYSAAHFSAVNPFGCPGLQDRQRDDWSKCKIVLLRTAILILIILGFPIMLPAAMVAVGPVLVTQFLFDCCYPETCLAKVGLVAAASVIGMVANPIVWIGCLIYLIPKGIKRLYAWYHLRQEEQQRRNTFLQERLLGEEIYQQKLQAV